MDIVSGEIAYTAHQEYSTLIYVMKNIETSFLDVRWSLKGRRGLR